MEYKATNIVNKDIEYLHIIVDYKDYTPYWLCYKYKGYSAQSSGFFTLIGAKRYATQNFQNPKWNKKIYPKIEWVKILNSSPFDEVEPKQQTI